MKKQRLINSNIKQLITVLVLSLLGFNTIAQITFEEVLDPNDQFLRKKTHVSQSAHRLSVVDFDNDGDADIICGTVRGVRAPVFFENVNGDFIERKFANNPLSQLFSTAVNRFIPDFADIDADGDLDIVMGTFNSQEFFHFRNDNINYAEVSGGGSPFGATGNISNASPEFIDFDNDSDLDLVCGNSSGTFDYFENVNGIFTSRAGTVNPLNGLSTGAGNSHPSFSDVDGDGDKDLLVGDNSGTLKYFQNNNGTFVNLVTTGNPFLNSLEANELEPHPEFVDFDNDGDDDVIVGNANGYFRLIENVNGTYVKVTGNNDPFKGLVFGDWANIQVLDYDNDGDLDVVSGVENGSVNYYLNSGSDFLLQDGANNPFSAVSVGGFATPVFVDLDNDSDLDLVVGNELGGFSYYNYDPNSRNAYTLKAGALSPLDGIAFPNAGKSDPIFIDEDNDGDLDMVVAVGNGRVFLVENTPAGYQIVSGAGTRFDLVKTGNSLPTSVAMTDLDSDNKLDLVLTKADRLNYFVGNSFGYTSPNTHLFSDFILSGRSSVLFVDVDNDSDQDLLVVDFDGNVTEFKNLGVVTSLDNLSTTAETLTIYPNPASNIINTEKGYLEVYDGMGNLVLGLESQGKVSVSNLSAGIYFVYQNGRRSKLIVE